CKYLVEPALRTEPLPGFQCAETSLPPATGLQHPGQPPTPPPPKLFRAYLDISARLCGPPAIDREFKTIDFLTLLHLHAVPDRVRTRFFQYPALLVAPGTPPPFLC